MGRSRITWEDGLTKPLDVIGLKSRDVEADVAHGANVILSEAVALVPKESGDLAASGRVREKRGGRNTVGITFAGPYARWIHEHLWFKHPHGGQAKYLEAAMLLKGREAVNEAGDHLWRRIT